MNFVDQQTCYHHPDREAVVCCPNCRRFFCRECVTEHEDRMLCRNCLVQLTRETPVAGGRWLQHAMMLIQGLMGFAGLWYAFYLVGRLLLGIPDEFHEGAVWGSGWWDRP